MKKSIIAAGAASAVLAAMPVLGVFADPTPVTLGTPVVDTLSVNLAEVCTLSRDTYNVTDSNHPTTGTSALANDSFTITYKVQAKKLQQTGSYTADAVYTLANM